jgi:hypothetical protein
MHRLMLARRQIDRERREADRVFGAMRDGALLFLHFENGRPIWRLSTGQFVPANAANTVINRPDIASRGDGLFYGMPGQTWRFCAKE